MSYGRHQSFHLRKNWVNKGLKAIEADNKSIYKNDFKAIGLGKNMVSALRFWLEFSNIIELNNGEHILTDFGNLLFKYDRACNKKLSINLIHFYLSSSPPLKPQIYYTFWWFFNECEEVYFDKTTLHSLLIEWDQTLNARPTSVNTLKKDIDVLISTYTKDTPEHPEDNNYSLLGSLGLIRQDADLFYKSPINPNMISFEAMYYFILLQKKSLDSMTITLEDLTTGENSIGKIFNLNRIEIANIVDVLSKDYPIVFEKTSNLNTVKITSREKKFNDPVRFLEYAYSEGE